MVLMVFKTIIVVTGHEINQNCKGDFLMTRPTFGNRNHSSVYFIIRTMNAYNYTDVLEDVLFDYAETNYGISRFIFAK